MTNAIRSFSDKYSIIISLRTLFYWCDVPTKQKHYYKHYYKDELYDSEAGNTIYEESK